MEQAMFVSNTAVSEASKTMANRQAYALLEFDKNQPVVIEEPLPCQGCAANFSLHYIILILNYMY